ncbi:MAG: hypothetical protein BWY04_01502 [candidate division CPR1 bacterium ADurb.Bin160]|uniref:Uncharacterized protein n=1 Tax=candidate division CPR1 bacterium ADurb.Bin160 TaxID=1852826 RepID=A0A1V5ZI15_9BACT|nr:MAG: hypothetical protein BWY04_01502 [candidate division CPR1 bacterium ADurb.Bin160]
METETTGNKIPEPVQEEKNEVPTIPNENPPKETKETQTKISFTPVWKYQKGDKVFTKKYPNQSFRIVKQFGWTTNLENVYYIKSNRTHDEAYILEHELSYTLVF